MGLVHALRASAEAALGDDDGPLRSRAAGDGVRGSAAARRSLDLLEMLRERTAGNLTETERDTLWTALRAVRARLDGARPSKDGGPPSEERAPSPGSGDPPAGGERRPLPMAGDAPEPEPGA